jgi:hypothetical protein
MLAVLFSRKYIDHLQRLYYVTELSEINILARELQYKICIQVFRGHHYVNYNYV